RDGHAWHADDDHVGKPARLVMNNFRDLLTRLSKSDCRVRRSFKVVLVLYFAPQSRNTNLRTPDSQIYAYKIAVLRRVRKKASATPIGIDRFLAQNTAGDQRLDVFGDGTFIYLQPFRDLGPRDRLGLADKPKHQ